MTSIFFVNHAQFCSFPMSTLKRNEVSSSAYTVGALVRAVAVVTVGEEDLVGAKVPATGSVVGALLGDVAGLKVSPLQNPQLS